ncbi:MAG TPA: RidA family protein [Pyrinomonadaceae bacterium]|nr:RidA family protein [Pyrinomonadaceae bacterium]
MERKSFNAPDAPAPGGGYSQALEVRGHTRTLFVSGQVPETKDGVLAPDFESQCRLVWQNIEAQLRAAEMSLENIVKVTTFLSDRRHALDNSRIRQELLAGSAPALTVVIADIFDEKWLLEIEAIAMG